MSRRGLLRTAGIGALALPFIRTLTGRADDELPKRLVVWFQPNGTIPGEFFPDGGTTDFRFRRILEPLERHRERLIVMKGVHMTSCDEGPGDGHRGMGHVLTGSPLLSNESGQVTWGSSISIDQRIANEIGNETPYRSLELGVISGGARNHFSVMNYAGSALPIGANSSPDVAFERLFGEGLPSASGAEEEAAALLQRERRRQMRLSVLDSSLGDFSDLERRVGSEERRRLSLHRDIVRDLENRLEGLDLSSPRGADASCYIPTIGRTFPTSSDHIDDLLEAQMSISVAALACDLTRVVSLQWTRAVGNPPYNWLGVSGHHHNLSHAGDSDLVSRDALITINNWYAGRLADFMDRLDAIPDVEGSLLDNTLILCVNELGVGNRHSFTDVPFMLAGGGLGTFNMGRYVETDRPHNDLLLSVARAFGINDETFGDPRFCTGVMDNILV